MMMSFRKVARAATPGSAAITLLTSRLAPGRRSISVALSVLSELGDSTLRWKGAALTLISLEVWIFSSSSTLSSVGLALVMSTSDCTFSWKPGAVIFTV